MPTALHPPLKISKLRASAADAAALMRSLANEDRLVLMCQLSQGELCVGDLEERTGIRQPTLSQQLGVLRAQALVATRRDGKRIFYSLSDPKAMTVLRTLYDLYCGK